MSDLTGKVFGKLKVLYKTPRKKDAQGHSPRLTWHCLCECGNEVDVPTSSLNSGRTKSCGCSRKNIFTKAVEKQGFICFSPDEDCIKSKAGICCNLCDSKCEYACKNNYKKCGCK